METAQPAITLRGTLEYACAGGVSPVLENGSARGKRLDVVEDVGPMAPSLLYCYADAESRVNPAASGPRPDVVPFVDAHRREETGEQPVVRFSTDFWAGEGGRLPADTRLCLSAAVSCVNDYGTRCKEDCGQASVSLAWLRDRWRARSDGSTPLRVEVPLCIHSTRDNRRAGTVWLTVEELRREERAEFGPLLPHMNDEANLEHVKGMLDGYLGNYGRENDRFPAYVTGTEPINCPVFPGEVTVANTRLKLPLASFVLVETPHVSPAYWTDALAVHADRSGFDDPAAYAADYLKLPLEARCGQAGRLVFQYVQQFDYVADRTSATGKTRMALVGDDASGRRSGPGRPKEGIEMFGDACVVRCGDCEDLSLGLRQFLTAFCRDASFDPKSDDVRVRALADKQRLLRQYVAHLAIEGVTGAAVTDVSQRSAPLEVQGAHAALKLLPRDYHAACVARWNPSHPLATDPECSVVASEYRGRLPVLVGEGTGLVDPWAAPDPFPASRELVEACAALEPAKKLLRPPFATSPFYRVVLFSACADYMLSHRTGAFRFAMPVRGSQGATLGKGVRFADLVRKSPELRLVPFGFAAPLVPFVAGDASHRGASVAGNVLDDGRAVCEFTGEMMLAMRSVCKTRIPPPSFAGASDDGLKPVERVAHAGLQRLCDAVNPDRVAVRKLRADRSVASVDAYLQAPLDPSSPLLTGAAAHCAKFRAVYLGADYALQRLGSGLDAYRLTFYCDEVAAAETVATLRATNDGRR